MTEFAHMRLLLVNPPGEAGELAADMLSQAGYAEIITTPDPERTLELCVIESPDLVVLDLDVPGASHRALDAIRHLTEGAASLPVLALSATATADIRQWALSTGVRDFV